VVNFDIRALWNERQSAWMSKITNDGLTRPGTGRLAVATVGFKGLKIIDNRHNC